MEAAVLAVVLVWVLKELWEMAFRQEGFEFDERRYD